MSVFFKILPSGSHVYVAKTLLKDNMSDEQFESKSKIITAEQFLSKFKGVTKEVLNNAINEVKSINNKKLVKVNVEKQVLGSILDKSYRYFYSVNDVYFAIDEGKNAKVNEVNELKEFLKKYYNEELLVKITNKKSNGMYYFYGNEEISGEKFNRLISQKEKLTKIYSIDKLLSQKENLKR